ncbi:MAG: hypothetical protein GY842_11805 [bacterium]|nr:hypothetical protein [bacterium]
MTVSHYRPSRARRVAKWTGLVGCALIVVAWTASLCCTLHCLWDTITIRLIAGGLNVATNPNMHFKPSIVLVDGAPTWG